MGAYTLQSEVALPGICLCSFNFSEKSIPKRHFLKNQCVEIKTKKVCQCELNTFASITFVN